MTCLQCGTKLTGKSQKKFCSSSCAASYNNRGVRRNGQRPTDCAVCGKPTSRHRRIYCSRECYDKGRIKPRAVSEPIEKVRKITPGIRGPYRRKSDGRYIGIVTRKDGTRTTVSYPRILMERHLGRQLLPEETVDHINEDPSDNRIGNLRLLSRSDNVKRSTYRVLDSRSVCAWCGVPLTGLSKAQVRSKKAGPFCSRQCTGKYGAALQNRRTEKLYSKKTIIRGKFDHIGRNNPE